MKAEFTHLKPHPLRGHTVHFQGKSYILVDWLDRVLGGKIWYRSKQEHKLIQIYHHRRAKLGRKAPPRDNEVVVLGNTLRSGYIPVHITEFEHVTEDQGAAGAGE